MHILIDKKVLIICSKKWVRSQKTKK